MFCTEMHKTVTPRAVVENPEQNPSDSCLVMQRASTRAARAGLFEAHLARLFWVPARDDLRLKVMPSPEQSDKHIARPCRLQGSCPYL